MTQITAVKMQVCDDGVYHPPPLPFPLAVNILCCSQAVLYALLAESDDIPEILL